MDLPRFDASSLGRGLTDPRDHHYDERKEFLLERLFTPTILLCLNRTKHSSSKYLSSFFSYVKPYRWCSSHTISGFRPGAPGHAGKAALR